MRPPEQYRNQRAEIDSRVDLFALGVTLYEATMGVNPFRDGTRDQGEVFKRIEGQSLSAIARVVDRENLFPDFVISLTRRYRDQRPKDAAEAFDWIEDICTKERVL